jgi:putative endonuclease
LAQTHKQRIGTWGERVAAGYLEQRGYRILAWNARTPYGEIDLVTQMPGGVVVFVEVKTRTNASFGLPEEAVDARKLEHLFRAAEVFLQAQPGLEGLEWRIDAIAIQGRPGDKVEDVHIEHFENISA